MATMAYFSAPSRVKLLLAFAAGYVVARGGARMKAIEEERVLQKQERARQKIEKDEQRWREWDLSWRSMSEKETEQECLKGL